MPISYREADQRPDDEIIYFSYERENARAPSRRRKRVLGMVGLSAVAIAASAAYNLLRAPDVAFAVFNTALTVVACAFATMLVYFESPPPGNDFVSDRRQAAAGQCSRARSSLTGVDQSRSQ